MDEKPFQRIIDACVALRDEVHAQQTRKDGTPYKGHPQRVAGRVFKRLSFFLNFDPHHKALAIGGAHIHDVLEDGPKNGFKTEDLRRRIEAIDPKLLSIAEDLTRYDGESYFDFIHRILKGGNFISILIKICDLEDNMEDGKEGSQKDKYRFAFELLRKQDTINQDRCYVCPLNGAP